jgi:hypothetical protein
MKGDKIDQQTLTLDSQRIAAQLRPKLRKDVSFDDIHRTGVEVAARALTRMALNECGGLPGLPAPRRGVFRRLINWLSRPKRSGVSSKG